MRHPSRYARTLHVQAGPKCAIMLTLCLPVTENAGTGRCLQGRTPVDFADGFEGEPTQPLYPQTDKPEMTGSSGPPSYCRVRLVQLAKVATTPMI